jgi:hypothetical protein
LVLSWGFIKESLFIKNLTAMSDEAGSAWHEVLHARLEDAGQTDESIIRFIEEEIPDEGEILDFKQDLYISAKSRHHDKKRRAQLLKHFSALSNVRTSARFRYLFIGFNDEGKFIGMQYRDQREGDQVLDVDDADLRNIFTDKVTPSPDFEVFELEQNGNRGGVIVIRQGEQVPLVIESTLRKGDGSAFITEGQAYTRDGSRTTRMGSDDFAEMMRYREELITAKTQELTQGLSKVIGIPDDQLANIDLNVTQSDKGVPVRDLVTTEAPKTIDEELTTAVKGSKGSGGHDYKRKGLYEFFARRSDIDLDESGDEKIEFIVRASLQNYLHGSYWLSKYESGINNLINKIISEDINGRTISSAERVLLVMGRKGKIKKIKQKYSSKYRRSKADRYLNICGKDVSRRVREYCGKNVKVGNMSYSVDSLISEKSIKYVEDLMDKIVNCLLDDDDSPARSKLRKLELIYLGSTM